jgi:spermidine/putrescine transport system permease protein
VIGGYHQRAALRNAGLIGPAVAVIGLFMIAPLLLMVYISFLERSMHGGVHWDTMSTEAYVRFLFEHNLDDSLSLNFDYLQIFARSIWLSLVTTVTALAVGLPTALYIAVQPRRYRNLLIFLVTIPFWTNLLVRNYAWILLLRDGGLINVVLMRLGIIDAPIRMLYTDFAVGVGLTYSFLPFMVLPIYTSLEKLDFRMVEAAYDLYSTRWNTLRQIVIPLARPGIVAGCILVFVPCLGAYVTPALLGGSKALMIGNLIQLQFGDARNWPFGAALAFVLLAVVLLAMMFYVLRAPSPGKGGR